MQIISRPLEGSLTEWDILHRIHRYNAFWRLWQNIYSDIDKKHTRTHFLNAGRITIPIVFFFKQNSNWCLYLSYRTNIYSFYNYLKKDRLSLDFELSYEQRLSILKVFNAVFAICWKTDHKLNDLYKTKHCEIQEGLFIGAN